MKATQNLQLKVHSIMTVPIFNTSHTVCRQNLPLRETKKNFKSNCFKGSWLPIIFYQTAYFLEELAIYFIQGFLIFIQSYKSIN